jgi:hypothetical protein
MGSTKGESRMERSKRITEIWALSCGALALAVLGVSFIGSEPSFNEVKAGENERSITYIGGATAAQSVNVDASFNYIHVKNPVQTITYKATTIVGGDSGSYVLTTVKFLSGDLIVGGKYGDFLICNARGTTHGHVLLSFSVHNLQSFSLAYNYKVGNTASQNYYTLYSDLGLASALGTTTLATNVGTSDVTISYHHATGEAEVNGFAVSLLDDAYTGQLFVKSIKATWQC